MLLVAWIFAPLAAGLIQMAVSRSREFQADESGPSSRTIPMPCQRSGEAGSDEQQVPPPHSLQRGGPTCSS